MSNRPYRPFDHERDMEAVQRIWIEVGWNDADEARDLAATAEFFKSGHTEVGTIDDRAECAVHWTPGTVQYQDKTLDLGVVTGVTTSHLARKLGYARELTARALAAQAKDGKAVSALGMFDQGFYNKLGYGTGPYVNEVQFDPSTLLVEADFRPPKRLTVDDFEAVHGAMVNRRKLHGTAILHPVDIMKAELAWTENPFGLGYFDGPGGSLSHFVWGEMKGEHGPYRITVRAYQTTEQLMELLALLKSLGDQISSFIIREFGEFQFQDLLRLPFRTARTSRGGAHASRFHAYAEWQVRMLDLAQCLAATSLPHFDQNVDLTFNLALTDPVAEALTPEDGWQGLGGDYTLTLGEACSAKPGKTSGLPTLKASVNALSRLWFGIRPASHLALTDALEGDEDLIKALDLAFAVVPVPDFGWDF